MTKHPDCEAHCQLQAHKGYVDCERSGECDAHQAENADRIAAPQPSTATSNFGPSQEGPRQKQPGTRVAPAERQFIADMRKASAGGVGYGWMQQIIEWEWQSKYGHAWGPEYYERRIAELEKSTGPVEPMKEIV